MAWELTDGLANLRAQVNARWPDRDHESDGSIGDLAHMGSTSGHNADDTPGSRPAWDGDPDSKREVRAWDCDTDFRETGMRALLLVDHLRRLPGLSRVIRYMIFNRKMYHSRDGFAPTAYDGPSAHTEHIHFEGAFSQAADENTSFDFDLWEINMPTIDEIKVAAKAAAKEAFAEALDEAEAAAVDGSKPGVTALGRQVRDSLWQIGVRDRDKILAAVAGVDEELMAKLNNPATPDAQVAAVLKQLLGSRKDAVVALMK
jgi:hypothetical protein